MEKSDSGIQNQVPFEKSESENKDPNNLVKAKDTQKVKEDDSDEEQLSKDEIKLWEKIEEILKDYHLTAFQKVACKKFIKDKVGNPKNKTVDRLRDWLFMRMNGQRMPSKYHPRQLGCPDLVPGLSLKGWWDRQDFEWIKKLESKAEIIRQELLTLRSEKGFQPYRSPAYASKNIPEDQIGSLGNDSGQWNVFYLYLHDIQFEENCAKVPETIKILQEVIPRNYFHAFFSAITPGTHITPHNGPTGKKLRVHLPLLGTEGARMRVGDEIKYLEQDKCIIFDDSFNHEAWHDGQITRINLILDFWHPELSDDEVKFFQMLLKAKLKGEKFISEKIKNNDHLYAIIEQTKDLIKSNDQWWIS